MAPTTEALVKKLALGTSLVVLVGAIGLLLVACGSQSSARPAHHRAAAGPAGWHAVPAAPVALSAGPVSVWTGREMIVSGVSTPGPDGTFLKSSDLAEAYDPTTHTWRRLPSPPETPTYCRRGAVWTGKEMLVWGCGSVAFDPQSNQWRRLPEAPTGEGIVVWTGREMIGWGGGCCGDAWSGGSAYDPAANTWRTLSRTPLAPSQGGLGAWTGRELVLFVSGFNPAGDKPYPARFARAAAYDPATDTWRRITPLPEHGLRFGGTAVWDGHELLVVGAGEDSRGALAYNPAANQWRRLSPLPSGRVDPKAVWTGTRLLVWGSSTDVSSSSSRTGLAYDPTTDRWSSLPPAPLQGNGQTVAWTGLQLLVWGGVIGTPVGTAHPEEYPKYLTDGAAYTPSATERSGR
jgi:hypothetical protein